MTTINLKDFYPWYTHDEYIEVSEEVADELRASRLYEAAYQRRIVRNKAQFSLDCEDGIEYSACVSEPTPQELLERMEQAEHFIFMEFYIMAEGQLWDRLMDIFRRKAGQGVEIKVLFDDFGSMMRMPEEAVEELRRKFTESSHNIRILAGGDPCNFYAGDV